MASGIKIDQESSLSVQERFDMVQRLQTGAPISRIAGEFDIHPSTARRIRRKAVTVCQPAEQKDVMWMRGNTRKLNDEDVDVRLYAWYMEQNALGNSVTDSKMWEKAVQLQKELGGPTISRGWLTNFKERHRVNLTNIEPAGNSNPYSEVYVKEELCLKEEVMLDVDEDHSLEGSSSTEVDPKEYLNNLTDRLRREGITNKNIYYLKDTTLAWKAFPTKLLKQCKRKKDKNAKFKRDRVTVALCCNVTGCHKLEPLFVYKNENPKALKHCRDRLPVLFKSQSEARINREMFVDWFENHFKPTVKILQFPDSAGKIILLLDDEQRHNFEIPRDFGQTDDVRILFYPATTNPILQPLEQETADKTKRSYRLKMLSRVLNYPGGVRKFYFDFDLKDCIDLFTEAWTEINITNIQAAWNKIVNKIPQIYGIKEEPADPLEPNLQDIIGVISGEQEPEETVNEFLFRCEEAEKNFMLFDGIGDDDDDNDDAYEDDEDENEDELDDETNNKPPTEQVMKKAFDTLLTWSKQQPQYIQLQVEYLKNYYESTISNKKD